MPASTAHGVPYPLPDDLVQNGAGDMQAIAESLEAKVLNGALQWGPPGAPDTSVSRSGAGTVRIGNILHINRGVFLDLDGAGYGLAFGATGDVYIYRAGPGGLRSSGLFAAEAGLQLLPSTHGVVLKGTILGAVAGSAGSILVTIDGTDYKIPYYA